MAIAFSNSKLCPVIKCAICNKIVDECCMEQNYYEDCLMFRVKCHGDVDYCKVTNIFVLENGLPKEGIAFEELKYV